MINLYKKEVTKYDFFRTLVTYFTISGHFRCAKYAENRNLQKTAHKKENPPRRRGIFCASNSWCTSFCP